MSTGWPTRSGPFTLSALQKFMRKEHESEQDRATASRKYQDDPPADLQDHEDRDQRQGRRRANTEDRDVQRGLPPRHLGWERDRGEFRSRYLFPGRTRIP